MFKGWFKSTDKQTEELDKIRADLERQSKMIDELFEKVNNLTKNDKTIVEQKDVQKEQHISIEKEEPTIVEEIVKKEEQIIVEEITIEKEEPTETIISQPIIAVSEVEEDVTTTKPKKKRQSKK